MSNRVLLISGNFYPEPTGIGKYCGEMIDWMSENGYECTVITTFAYYPDWKIQKQFEKYRFWYKKEVRQTNKNGSNPIVIIRCPHYVPSSPTGMKRLLSEFTISFFSYFALFFLFFSRKYNYVMTVAPPFELGLLGVFYKKIRGATFSYHIQDLQIDAARDLGMIKSSLVLNFFFAIEKYIINNADHISSISEGMIKKIKLKCEREVIYFPNWVDTKVFHPIADKPGLKLQYGFNATDRIILYSGAIGEKQGLQSIIHLAKKFEKFQHVKFIICGSGPYKGHLVELKDRLGVSNLTFLPVQPFANFNSFLNIADIHLVIQKSNAADLVMPSKLCTILSVGGIAIVTANPGTSLYNLMNSADMGILIEPENPEVLEKAINYALTIDLAPKEYNARNYAEYNFSINEVLSKFEKSVLKNKNKGNEGMKTENVVLSGQTNT